MIHLEYDGRDEAVKALRAEVKRLRAIIDDACEHLTNSPAPDVAEVIKVLDSAFIQPTDTSEEA
jgi:hypothetical protein